ncbi:TPA: hypothetical protein LSH88_004156 [Serratia marcescens]|nr:hypothetical protein [Serratia marcescens]
MKEKAKIIIKVIIIILISSIIFLSGYAAYKDTNASNIATLIGALVALLTHEKWPFFNKPKTAEKFISSREGVHDKKIILDIMQMLPLEDTKYCLEYAHTNGAPLEFLRKLDRIESAYLSVEKKIYNPAVEEKKQIFISAVKEFNIQAAHFLGLQENPGGNVCLPPYHWKNYKGESEDRYYSLQEKVRDSAYNAVDRYTEFLDSVHTSKILLATD